MLTRSGVYFETKYMIFTNSFKLADNTTVTSPNSAQLIVYTVIPETPSWDGIHEN